MTTEEAVRILRSDAFSTNKRGHEAALMAIEALRKQDVPVTNVEDMVYKKDVLYALEKCRNQCGHEDKMGDEWIHYETAQNEIECVQPVIPMEQTTEILKLRKDLRELPSAEPEPLSQAYARAVWTWLLNYQVKSAELKGAYSPYEVLSWVINDWRKENGLTEKSREGDDGGGAL